MPRIFKSHGAALFLIAVLYVCAALMYTVFFPDPVIAQPQPPGPIRYVTADPTGQACTARSITLRTPSGALFTCSNGVYAAAGSSGTVTSIATTAPITGGTITGTGTIALNVAVDHAFTASQSVTRNNIGAVSTDAFLLTNTTAAAAGAQQWSPRLRWVGQGWKTTATAASQQTEFIADVEPSQQAANPDALLVFRAIIGGASSTQPSGYFCADGTGSTATTGLFGLDGVLSACNNGQGFAGLGSIGAANVFASFTNGAPRLNFNNNGMSIGSASGLLFTSGAVGNSITGDAGVSRGGVGIIAIGTGTVGSTVGNLYSAGLNFGTTENGANNAIACAAGCGPTLTSGMVVTIKLAHTLQAGANTFAFNGGGALNIKSHNNVANNIAAAYASGSLVQLGYDGTQWQDMSQ